MKIALIGYGKMGRMIEQVAVSRGHEIVCIIDVDNQGDFDGEAFGSADVAIEFTSPSSAYENVCRAFARGVKVVSGSTGWMERYGDEVRRMCEEEGRTLFWSSNFSVGVAIFSALNRYLAELMNRFGQYEPSLVETHHVHKLDHPSGTAISLAEDMIGRLDGKTAWCTRRFTRADGTIVCEHEPGVNEVPIDCVREGEVAGVHTVRYESEADGITITHCAHSRMGFALGAVLAAEYTAEHSGLLRSMLIDN